MNPFVKVLRAILLLPVKDAELREQRVAQTDSLVRTERAKAEMAAGALEARSAHLRETFDQLLERTKWHS